MIKFSALEKIGVYTYMFKKRNGQHTSLEHTKIYCVYGIWPAPEPLIHSHTDQRFRTTDNSTESLYNLVMHTWCG